MPNDYILTPETFGAVGDGKTDDTSAFIAMAGYIHCKPTKCYPRYGGMMQLYPLTADEQKYDDTCREIDDIEREIGTKSMALFTVVEFMWFSRFVHKMHVFPKQEQLDCQLSELRSLLTSLEARTP